MHSHGIWDLDELYGLTADPHEMDTLPARPGHEALAERLSGRLSEILERTGGMQTPICTDAGTRNLLRDPKRLLQAPFPPHFFDPPES